MRGFSSRCFATYPNLYLDPRAEPVKNRDKAVQGKPSEVCVAYSGEVRGGDAGTGMGASHRKVVAVERFDDFGR